MTSSGFCFAVPTKSISTLTTPDAASSTELKYELNEDVPGVSDFIEESNETPASSPPSIPSYSACATYNASSATWYISNTFGIDAIAACVNR